MKEIQAAVIGIGVMGMLHAGILNSMNGVRVKAMVDTEKFVTNFLKKTLHNIEIYNEHNTMIKKSNVDLIYITTPVNSHIEIAKSCVNNNIPFFIEKPLARNLEECKELCKMLQINSVINMTGFYLRYVDSFHKAKQFLDQNILGNITKINCSVSRPLTLTKNSGWRFNKKLSGGGVLIDIGISLIDLLLWYFGKIKSVKGRSETNYLPDIEDFVVANLVFENGLNCEFVATWNVPNHRIQETNIEITGELGNMKVNEDYLKITLKNQNNYVNGEQLFLKPSLYRGVEYDIGGPMYTREDLDFINCITKGIQSPLNTIQSSMTQSVVDCIYKSCITNNMESVTYIE